MFSKRFFLFFFVAFLLVGACSQQNSTDIHYQVYGKASTDKPSIVFIHGWMGNQTLWKGQVDFFKNKYQVITLDLAGHGKSTAKRKNYTMTSFGEDVAKVVKKVGADKVVLIGHSMGGPVALEAAEVLGDKTLAVVGVDTFYTPFQYPQDEKSMQEFLKPFREDFEKNVLKIVQGMFGPNASKELKDTLMQGIKTGDQAMGMNAFEHLFRWRMTRNSELSKKYNSKLFNINGNPDGSQKSQRTNVVLISGAAHFPAQTKTAEFNQALLSFLSDF